MRGAMLGAAAGGGCHLTVTEGSRPGAGRDPEGTESSRGSTAFPSPRGAVLRHLCSCLWVSLPTRTLRGFSTEANGHRIPEQFGLKGTVKTIQFQQPAMARDTCH